MVKKITTILLITVILTSLFTIVFSGIALAKGNPNKKGPNLLYCYKQCKCDRMGRYVCRKYCWNGRIWYFYPWYQVGCCTYPCPN